MSDTLIRADSTSMSQNAIHDSGFNAIESFKASFLARQQSANAIVSRIAGVAVKAVAVKDAIDEHGGGTRFVVDMSNRVEEGIRNGTIKLDVNKNGDMYAQVRDVEGHYGKKLPIKEELAEQGIDSLEAMNALQLQAIKQQLEEVTQTLEEIGMGVEDVLKGQQNDRLGLYYSGMSLYIESQEIVDDGFRKLVASQAVRSLSDANAQMILEMQADIRYLEEGKYEKKRGRTAEIDARMANITKCFEVIHRSAVLKAAIYFAQGEMPAMLTTFDEYGKFLDKVIVPNAGALREFDATDTLLQDGAWERRARSLLEVEGITHMLTGGTTFYLEAGQDDNNEG